MVHQINAMSADQRYNQSAKGRAARRRYRQSAKGKAAAHRAYLKARDREKERERKRAMILAACKRHTEYHVDDDGTIRAL